MRIPSSTRPSGCPRPSEIARALVPALFALALLLLTPPRSARAQDLASSSTVTAGQQRMHQSDQSAEIQKHLPDPHTASPQVLEQQADILRARRFPEDAMDYYKYALDRGGNPPALLNKLGLAQLEMHHIQLARAYFQRVVKIDRRDAEAWNNLGASEFVDGRNSAALSDYKHAIKLSRHNPVFHANLATADFECKDYRGARREIAAALELDPHVFEQKGTGGIAAHVLSGQDQARFAFEMARMYARSNMEDEMLHAIARAAEAGMDVQSEMAHDPVLARYQMDPRVVVLVRNAELVRATRIPTISATGPTTSAPAPVHPLAE